MQTSLRVDAARRDELARIAAEDLGGVSMDEALRVLIFEHRTRAAFARLATDPLEAASYLEELTALADVDVDVQE